MTDGLYRLYGRKNAGSLAVQAVLEEIGAPYELVFVGKSPAELEAYRRINPSGKVPALALPDGSTLCESAAMLIHLCNAHPAAALAPPPGSAAHARFLQWLVFLSANVYEAALRSYYSERYSAAGAAAADGIKVQAERDYAQHLGSVHQVLAPYVLGATLSAADPYLHMLAAWYPGDLAVLHARLPGLARHAQLMRGRPAVRKAEADHAE